AKSDALVSSTEHRGRLALVGKREAVDQRRMLEQELQIEGDAGPPGWLDRQRQRLDACGGERAHVIGVSAARQPRRRSRLSRRFRLTVWGFAGHARTAFKISGRAHGASAPIALSIVACAGTSAKAGVGFSGHPFPASLALFLQLASRSSR